MMNYGTLSVVLFFWINRAIITGEHNGELSKSVEDFIKAEDSKKELDKDIIAGTEI